MQKEPAERGDPEDSKWSWNPRVSAFMMCLLLAAGFWFLHALSREYVVKVNVPVEYSNLPEGRLVAVELPDSLTADLKASGFTLLTYMWTKEREAVKLDMSRARSIGAGDYALATNSVPVSLYSAIGKNIRVLRLYPDTVIASFEGRVQKRVPVKPQAIINYAPGYKAGDSVRVYPEYVIISGPEALLERIDYVQTEIEKFDELTDVQERETRVVLPEGVSQVSVQPSVVSIRVTAGKYTEATFTIPVSAINVPADAELKTFPDKVQVVFEVAVDDFAKMDPDMFRAVVDFRKLSATRQQADIELIRTPANVKNIRLVPAQADYLIRR